MFRTVTSFVRTNFKKYPFVANSIIYGTLYATAETTQQTLHKKILSKEKQEIDTKQIGRFAIISTTCMAPMLYHWYKWLDGKLPGTAKKTVFRKLIIDQFGFTPILICVFFTGMSILEGKQDILEEAKTKFPKTFATSCAFWIPMTTINFLLVPPTLRVVYVGCCTCIWSNILCYIKSM